MQFFASIKEFVISLLEKLLVVLYFLLVFEYADDHLFARLLLLYLNVSVLPVYCTG